MTIPKFIIIPSESTTFGQEHEHHELSMEQALVDWEMNTIADEDDFDDDDEQDYYDDDAAAPSNCRWLADSSSSSYSAQQAAAAAGAFSLTAAAVAPEFPSFQRSKSLDTPPKSPGRRRSGIMTIMPQEPEEGVSSRVVRKLPKERSCRMPRISTTTAATTTTTRKDSASCTPSSRWH